jgi:uncharacterized protein YxjI
MNKKGRPTVKVKAKANFTKKDKTEVKEGDTIELEGAELAFRLNSGQVTKDLTWTPEERGGQ